MGSHDRNGCFRSIIENFNNVKRTGVMVSSSFGDRLTTGRRQPSLYMGEASVYKAQLCAPTNDAHL
tara:strand:+ start:130107 stop:130304 length:198 start_codon:yes stop_codon:yes gene_type:complete